jgi:hypothetical protein
MACSGMAWHGMEHGMAWMLVWYGECNGMGDVMDDGMGDGMEWMMVWDGSWYGMDDGMGWIMVWNGRWYG